MKHINIDSKNAPSTDTCGPNVAALAVAALVAALMTLWPQTAAALEDACTEAPPQRETREATLREKASRFAPTVELRLWVHPDDRHEDRQLALPAAVTAAPQPVAGGEQPNRTKFQADRPFGWQIQFKWDLVRMLQATRPDSWRRSGRLVPSGCRTLRQRVSEDFDELWLGPAPPDADELQQIEANGRQDDDLGGGRP